MWPAAPREALISTRGQSLPPHPGLDACSTPAFTLGQERSKADYFYSTMHSKSYSMQRTGEGNESHPIGKEGVKLPLFENDRIGYVESPRGRIELSPQTQQ